MTSNFNAEKYRFKELDSLRGFAAVIVMMFHFSMGKWLPFGLNILRLGATGVDLFFMISGFVIYMSFSHINSSRQFIQNRFLRLYPTYWIALTFTFALICLNSLIHDVNLNLFYIKQYLGNLTMFQYYLDIPDLDGPYWTLIIELVFYIFIVSLFQVKLLRYTGTIGFTICVLIMILQIFGSEGFFAQFVKYFPLLTYLPLFITGILFYQIKINNRNLIPLYLMITGLFFIQLLLYPFIRNKMFFSHTEYGIVLLVYFIIFYFLVTGKLLFIVNSVTQFFGKISYSLYLVHQYLSLKIITPLLTGRLHFNFLVTVFVSFLASIAVALIVTILADMAEKKIRSYSIKSAATRVTISSS